MIRFSIFAVVCLALGARAAYTPEQEIAAANLAGILSTAEAAIEAKCPAGADVVAHPECACPTAANIMDLLGLVGCFTGQGIDSLDPVTVLNCLAPSVCPAYAAEGETASLYVKFGTCQKSLTQIVKGLAPTLAPFAKDLLPEGTSLDCVPLTRSIAEEATMVCYPPFNVLINTLCAAMPNIEKMVAPGAERSEAEITTMVKAFACTAFSEKAVGAATATATKTDVDIIYSCETDPTVKVSADALEAAYTADGSGDEGGDDTPSDDNLPDEPKGGSSATSVAFPVLAMMAAVLSASALL